MGKNKVGSGLSKTTAIYNHVHEFCRARAALENRISIHDSKIERQRLADNLADAQYHLAHLQRLCDDQNSSYHIMSNSLNELSKKD